MATTCSGCGYVECYCGGALAPNRARAERLVPEEAGAVAQYSDAPVYVGDKLVGQASRVVVTHGSVRGRTAETEAHRFTDAELPAAGQWWIEKVGNAFACKVVGFDGDRVTADDERGRFSMPLDVFMNGYEPVAGDCLPAPPAVRPGQRWEWDEGRGWFDVERVEGRTAEGRSALALVDWCDVDDLRSAARLVRDAPAAVEQRGVKPENIRAAVDGDGGGQRSDRPIGVALNSAKRDEMVAVRLGGSVRMHADGTVELRHASGASLRLGAPRDIRALNRELVAAVVERCPPQYLDGRGRRQGPAYEQWQRALAAALEAANSRPEPRELTLESLAVEVAERMGGAR